MIHFNYHTGAVSDYHWPQLSNAQHAMRVIYSFVGVDVSFDGDKAINADTGELLGIFSQD